jgi:acetyl esterase/lipase
LYNYSKEIEITGNKELMTEDDVEGFIVALEESLAAVESDQINMMYVSWSIGDAGRAQDPNIEVWLQAVEPYVEAGLVEWATLPEIYDQYLDWEQGITDYSDDEPVVSGDELVQVYEDIEYAEVDGISLELDLYRPAGVDGDLPLIIWIHGGGWLSGDKSDVDEMCKRLVMDDFAVASLDFRLSGDALWPAQIHDVKAAVRWLRAHADNYDLDPDSFGVIGSSSGGHLASLLGVTGGVEALEGVVGNYDHVSSQVSAVVDMFGPVNLHRLSDDCAGQCVMDHSAADSPESSLLGCALSECLDQAELASVSTYVTADDPPFLIIHGDQDSTIPIAQSMNLVSDLEDAGVEAEFIKATDFAHSRTMFWEYDEQIVRFLNQKLK